MADATIAGRAPVVVPVHARGAAESLRYAVFSIIAILATMIFFFPIYWSLSTSLRNPIDTFTVAGIGIPWVNFKPTLNNWIDQALTPETAQALTNSTLIAAGAALLAILLGTPAAYALARFRFT